MKYFENIGIRPELYYLRTKTGKEIDLLIRTVKGLLPVEIKLSKSPTKSMTESLEYFYTQIKELNLEKGIIVSLINDELPLSKNVTAYSFNKYFEYLNKKIL